MRSLLSNALAVTRLRLPLPAAARMARRRRLPPPPAAAAARRRRLPQPPPAAAASRRRPSRLPGLASAAAEATPYGHPRPDGHNQRREAPHTAAEKASGDAGRCSNARKNQSKSD